MVSCDQISEEEDSHFIFKEENMADMSHLLDEKASFLCLNQKEIKLAGSYHMDKFEYLRIRVHGCDQAECVDPADFPEITLDFLQTDTMVDFEEEDHSKVFKQFINANTYYKIRPQVSQLEDRYYMKSVLELKDSLLRIFDYHSDVYTTDKEVEFIENGERW